MSGNETRSINSHIEDYLDYYCGLSHAPGFAILLKGKWGCGKTWFINKYREKLEKEKKKQKQKFLYISLYGMTSFSEIENIFFQQLFPIRSSKVASITSKVLQGLIKASLKIDLNNDGKDDTVSLQIPKIELPKSLENVDNSILIFDDLERCKIDIGNLLGYINYFVEHQGLKVILVANEEKLLENDSYKYIKEKLIGKTFDVSRDLHGALKYFIQEISNPEIQNFLLNNIELIEQIYLKVEYENLRSLKQIILDFERIFQALPEKAKSKSELIQDILQILIAFSIEIKRGTLLAQNIGKLLKAETFEIDIDDSHQVYSAIPIFKYIKEDNFIKKLLSISFGNQTTCFYGFKERYKYTENNNKIGSELQWLENVQSFLLEEATSKKGKLSGYRLELLNRKYLNEAINNLKMPNQDVIEQ